MNFVKLFETQAKLDGRILTQKKLQGRDLLSEKILALLTELGECANEQRSWKFWSEDKEPRTFAKCRQCLGGGTGYFSGKEWTGTKEVCIHCGGSGVDKSENPLLEEYVDNLHFILSLGLELHPMIGHMEWMKTLKSNLDTLGEPNKPNISELFILTFEHAIEFNKIYGVREYQELFFTFLTLGRALGFTFEQIENAYYEKNEINHERQNSNY